MMILRMKEAFTVSMVTGASLLAASSCSMVKNMGEMHDATQKMSQTTEGMSTDTKKVAETTLEVKKSSSNIDQNTEFLYHDLRQGNAMIIRRDSLKTMEAKSEMEAKISEAAKYYSAFEFQLWKNYGADDKERLELLSESAVQEYFRDIKPYLDSELDPSPSSDDDRKMNAQALAVTMFKVNPNEEALGKELSFEPISMLSLIKDGLQKRDSVESGKTAVRDLEPHLREVLVHSRDAVYLLQVRANFLAAAVLSEISKINDGIWLVRKLRGARMYLLKWKADKLNQLNTTQIVELTQYLQEAKRMNDFLVSIGENPRISNQVLKIYDEMDIPEAKLSGVKKAAIDGFLKALGDFKQAAGASAKQFE